MAVPTLLVRDALADEVRELGCALRRDVQHELQSWYKGHNGAPLQCNQKSNGPAMTVCPARGIDEEKTDMSNQTVHFS